MRKVLWGGLLAVVLVAAGLTVAWIQSPEAPIQVTSIPAVAQDASASPTASLNQTIAESGQAAVKQAIAMVAPAVVRVDVTGTISVTNPSSDFFNDPFFQRFFGIPNTTPQSQETQSVGSGVVIAYGGEKLVLTNAHVIDGADTIKVTDPAGDQWNASVVGKDELLDVAVLRIDGDTSDLATASLGDSDAIEIGDWAIAIGNPLGLSYSVTMGIISAVNRDIPKPSGVGSYNNLIQTDAAINPGNSGGPLVNALGEVVGINTIIARTASDGVAIEGINFAVSINGVKDVLSQLVETGSVSRGWLGVSVGDITPQSAAQFGIDPNQTGALVAQVFPGDPADVAGIAAGDVIVRIGDQTIESADDVVRIVGLLSVGKTVEIEVARDGGTQVFDVTLEERPSEEALVNYQGKTPETESTVAFGLTVGPITDIMAQHLGLNSTEGVVIMGVAAGSPADNAGLVDGDIILEVNRQAVADVDAWNTIVSSLDSTARVSLTVLRDGQIGFVRVQ
jgi:serine protease Do